MSFMDDLETKALPVRQAILSHPFVTGIGDGTLDVDKFRFYVRQDYLYLIDYSRVIALAAARAPDLETMGWFARLLDGTLNVEMDLHRGYCAEFGISREELEATPVAPTTMAYTRFLLNVAYQGTYPVLVAAFLPCQWGYWEIGDHLQRQGVPAHAPLYAKWIEMYVDPEFKNLADWVRSLANRLASTLGPEESAKVEEAYLMSLRYEYMFWDMAYRQEEWLV